MTHSFSPDSRRGISSVVGALIFTVLMIAGFSAMSLALDSQTDIVNTQRVVSAVELQAQQEEFEIQVSTNVNNILNVTIDNIGQNPVQISHLFITNKTMASQPVKDFFINSDDAYISPGHQSDVVSTQTLYMIPDIYDIKVISSLGTVKIAELNMISGSTNGLRSELITDPPDVIIGQNVTVAMIVTNTGDSTITNVHPNSLTFSSTGIGSVIASSSYTPTAVDLNGGASVMFSWDYQVTGNSGDNLTFSSFATGEGGKISNTVSDVSTLRLPTDGGTGQVQVDVLTDELLARPQLFLTIPGPAGEASSAKSLWGVNVVNPVNSTMKVTKVSVMLMGPGLTGSSSLVDCSGHVAIEGPDNWTCPVNTIMWENVATPIIIPPFSVKSFSVQVVPNLGNSISTMEAMMVQANVFSNSGAFGKSGYQSTMLDGNGVISSVYLSNVVDSVASSNMKTSRSGITPNSTQTFNVVFADLDGVDTTYIKSGGQLVINVPKGWTEVTVLNNYGFDTGANAPTIVAFGDGSHQITATLPSCTTACMGTTANPSNTIQFSAKAPDITNDQMYVMYILAIGETSNNFTLGPVSEVVLQVDSP